MTLDTYAANHSDRVNLLVHLVFVPVFHAGLVTAVLGHPIVGALLCLGSIAIQGRAHRREANRVTFAGPFDFVKRIFVEQLVTFPRLVLSGRLRAMLSDDGARRDRREARPTRS
jgi:hypothetical protein